MGEYRWSEVGLNVLEGQTIKSIEGLEEGSVEVKISTEEGNSYLFYHEQDCCEAVDLNDFDGDVEDLVGGYIVSAEEVEGTEEQNTIPSEEYSESYTWTFYKIETNKGGLWMRWLGESNGYYSESVEFIQTGKAKGLKMSEPSAGDTQLEIQYTSPKGETAYELEDGEVGIVAPITEVLGDGGVAGALKYDAGKPRMSLLPMNAITEVAKVMTFGAKKYADNGWKSLEDQSRYVDALLRHLAALDMGEEVDPETGLPHIAHVACNALFLTHFHLEDNNGA